MFPDIQEDKFESSDDGEEKKKNDRLERLSKVAAPSKNTLANVQEASLTNAGKTEQEDNDNILIAENGDILARYRIPLKDNKVDYDL